MSDKDDAKTDVVVKKIDSLAKEWKVEFQEINDKYQKEVDKLGEATSETKAQMKAVQDRLDELEVTAKRTHPDNKKENMEAEEHKALDKLFRNKADFNALEPEERKLLSSDIDPQGGYIDEDSQFAQSIISPEREMSPVRQVANVQTISGRDSMKVPVRATDSGASWGGERSTRAETDTPDLDLVTIYTHELYAYPKVTLEMIEDGHYDVVSYVQNDVIMEFSQTEGTAHINGSGSGQPLGVLQGSGVGALNSVTAAAGTLDPDELIEVFYSIKTPYSRRGQWAAHRNGIRELRKLRLDQGGGAGTGAYIWQPGISANEPPQILGRPYVEMDDLADPGSDGTYATNDVSFVFGDWTRGYTIVDRIQVSIQEDRVTAPGFVNYYVRKRTGGAPVLGEALSKYVMA